MKNISQDYIQNYYSRKPYGGSQIDHDITYSTAKTAEPKSDVKLTNMSSSWVSNGVYILGILDKLTLL